MRAPQHSARARRPWEAIRVNALRSRMRQIKPRACGGPWQPQQGLQNVPACPGAHAVAEAVLLGTTTIVWLECALHAALLEPPTVAVRQNGGPSHAALHQPRQWPDAKARGARAEVATGTSGRRTTGARGRARNPACRGVGAHLLTCPALICDLSTRCGQACG